MGEIIYCIIFSVAILVILGNKDQKGVVRMIVRKVVIVCQTYLRLYSLLYSYGVGVIANPTTKPS